MKIKKFTLASAALLASFALGRVAFADQETPAPAPATLAVTAPEATTTTAAPTTETATPAAKTASETSTTAENTTTAMPEASTTAAEATPVVNTPAPAPATPAAPAPEATTTTAAPTTETATPVAETPKVENKATEITKSGTEITVKNPEVVIDQSNGIGKYQEFTVEYKNIQFPDDMPINSGDKVTMTFPEELNFQTQYEFDVRNPEDAVVGKASTNPENRTVTTVFNDYFTTHPLNKQMSLKLDAKWTDKVESGKPVSVNFDGTVVTVNIGKEQEIGKDELIAKWGSQDENDPTVINWTARINYAKRVLNYVTIIDEMSENQKLVDNYFEIKSIESLDPWIDKGSAMDLVKSISKSDHGFTIKMDRLDHMIYINYKTKLTNAVKDSVNPTNKIELKAETDGATSYSYVQLVGGKGNASGENKPEPTWEIPNDAPKYEKPELNINDIPLMPPAPILEKPYLPIEDIPLLPPAPILEKPEYPIPAEPEKPNTPEKPKTPEKSKTPEPKKVQKQETVKVPVKYPTVAQKPAVKTLPHTGESSSKFAAFIGGVLTTFAVFLGLKAKNTKKETE